MEGYLKNYNLYTVRSAAILTNGVVNGSVIGTSGTGENFNNNLYYNNEMIVYVDFTLGSLTNGEIIIEFSPDGTNWYSETEDDISVSTGVITERPVTRIFAATGKYRIPIQIMDRNIRISATSTGTVTGSSMAISAAIGNA